MGLTISTDEALTHLRVWAADRTLVRVSLHFATVAARFLARVTEASDDRLALMADGLESECVIAVSRVVGFAYGDFRDWPREAETFDRMIILFLTDPAQGEDADYFALVEVREPRELRPIT